MGGLSGVVSEGCRMGGGLLSQRGSVCPAGAFVRGLLSVYLVLYRKKHEVHLQIYALSECSPALISIYVTVVILFW